MRAYSRYRQRSSMKMFDMSSWRMVFSGLPTAIAKTVERLAIALDGGQTHRLADLNTSPGGEVPGQTHNAVKVLYVLDEIDASRLRTGKVRRGALENL